MSISKNFLKSRPACKVKFQLSGAEACEASDLYLVGDFNKWDEASHPMKKMKDGGFSLEVELPLGQDCQFRYRSSENVWFNDPEADAYMPCTHSGAENCVVKV